MCVCVGCPAQAAGSVTLAQKDACVRVVDGSAFKFPERAAA